MKLLATAHFAFVFALIAAAPAQADPYADARAAYDRGDYGTARQAFLVLAELGDPKAQCMMGNIYLYARGVAPDRLVAAQWYKKAADKGEPIAQFELARTLAIPPYVEFPVGSGNVLDADQLVSLVRASAARGYVDAEVTLAVWFTDEDAQPKNPMEMAAGLNFGYGRLLKDVSKDNAEATAWFEKAAEHGSLFARAALAWRYGKGLGAPIDQARALFWSSLLLKSPPPTTDVLGYGKGVIRIMTEFRDAAMAKLSAAERDYVLKRVAEWKPKPMPEFRTLPDSPSDSRDYWAHFYTH